MASEIPSSSFPEDGYENFRIIEAKTFLGSIEKKALAQRNRISCLPEVSFSHKATLKPPLPQSIIRLTEGSDFMQEKLQELYNPHLPNPVFIDAEASKVIVWRGCTGEQLVKMLSQGSAGGVRVNRQTKVPSEEESKDQVGEKARLPEFTTNTQVAERFGRAAFVVACQIESKYLAKGSVAEQGLICNPDAPIKFLGWKYGLSLRPK